MFIRFFYPIHYLIMSGRAWSQLPLYEQMNRIDLYIALLLRNIAFFLTYVYLIYIFIWDFIVFHEKIFHIVQQLICFFCFPSTGVDCQ